MSSPAVLPPQAGQTAPAAVAPALPKGANPAQLHKVAQQFEALLVRQMLAAARSDGLGQGLGGSGAMDNFRAMQDERFASIAADKGSFGVARMIERQLTRRLATPPAKGG